MKLLLAFILIAAATAAEIPVRPVILGRAALPQVVESPVQTSKIQVVDSAPVAPAIETVKFVDSAPVPDTPEMVRFVDAPLEIALEDLHDVISKSELETIRIVEAAVEAVKFVNEAEPQAPVPAEEQVVEQVRFVDSPAEEQVEQVRFVDSPAEQIDAVKVAEIPQVAPEEGTKVRVVDFAPIRRPGKIFDNDMLR